MSYDVFYITVEDVTERIKGMCADMTIGAQTGQLTGADLIFVDQLILGYVLFFHCGPQLVVSDQTYLLFL